MLMLKFLITRAVHPQRANCSEALAPVRALAEDVHLSITGAENGMTLRGSHQHRRVFAREAKVMVVADLKTISHILVNPVLLQSPPVRSEGGTRKTHMGMDRRRRRRHMGSQLLRNATII